MSLRNLVLAISLSGSAQAFAYWSCDLTCNVSGNQQLDSLWKHSSGPAYSDFTATCSQVHQGRVTQPQSGCDYVYCVQYQQYTETVYGSGETLTEARQNARAACVSGSSSQACGVGFYRSEGTYNCYRIR